MGSLRILVALFVVLLVGGCAASDDVLRRYAEVTAALDDARAAAEAEAARLAAAEQTPETGEALADLREVIAGYDSLRARADEFLATWQRGESGPVDAVGDAVLPFLPPGVRLPAAAVLGLLAGWLQSRRNRTALDSLAASMVGLAKREPGVAEAVSRQAGYLTAKQLPAARAAINRAQAGKGSA